MIVDQALERAAIDLAIDRHRLDVLTQVLRVIEDEDAGLTRSRVVLTPEGAWEWRVHVETPVS